MNYNDLSEHAQYVAGASLFFSLIGIIMIFYRASSNTEAIALRAFSEAEKSGNKVEADRLWKDYIELTTSSRKEWERSSLDVCKFIIVIIFLINLWGLSAMIWSE